MLRLNATSTVKEYLDLVAARHPEINKVLRQASQTIPDRTQAIARYQAALLYMFAAQYDGQTIIDLGTHLGYSACILAMAAPLSRIFTVETNPVMLEEARRNLTQFDNIQFIHAPSWDFAERANDSKAGLVFVDADHVQVKRDLVWWVKLRPDGLMLFHDYTPGKFPEVVRVVNDLASIQQVHNTPDIICFGTNGDGLAGVYKR